MAAVELDHIRKVYPNDQVAVADASFQVADGELLVLVGPSGCGKSTLLRMIAGLEAISSGTLSIGGRVVNEVSPKDRDIAMVFQNYALYPHMTVAENLSFGLKLRGEPGHVIAERVAEAAAMLELEPYLDRKPANLSGGQRQRVALGRALVRKPQVFLLDEPLSNLDAKLRTAMRVEISRLHRRLGATMVYVTHDQIEAMTLGQRIVVLKDGVIQQLDTPMNLYARPANLFVAGFLGSPGMNILHGTLRRDPGLVLDIGQGARLPLGDANIAPEWMGREIAVGIRPEHLVPAENMQAAAFSPEVEVVEPVGNEVFLYLRFGGAALVSRVPPKLHQLTPGDRLPLVFAREQLHFFDPASGLRIDPAA